MRCQGNYLRSDWKQLVKISQQVYIQGRRTQIYTLLVSFINTIFCFNFGQIIKFYCIINNVIRSLANRWSDKKYRQI